MCKLIITGLFAGITNGLLGTGGGIILIFVLERMFFGRDKKDVFAMTLTVTLSMSIVSAVVYYLKGKLNFEIGVGYGLAGIPGGVIGAYLLNRLNIRTVKIIFGLLVIWVGLNMAGVI